MSEKITSSMREQGVKESAAPEHDRIASLPTPFFLVRESLLAENIGGFRRALDQLWPNSRIAYSVKTNALPWILRWMLSHGVDAEVVSDQEYELARLCGFPPQRIVFNGPVKGRETLRAALEGGATVNLDSASDLDAVVGRSCMLGLRLNVDPALFDPCDVGYQEDGFRFGYSEETGAFASALDRLSAVMDVLLLFPSIILSSRRGARGKADFFPGKSDTRTESEGRKRANTCQFRRLVVK